MKQQQRKLWESYACIRFPTLIGAAYLRFTGDLKFEHYQTDTLVETQRDESLWELMYFGHVPRE